MRGLIAFLLWLPLAALANPLPAPLTSAIIMKLLELEHTLSDHRGELNLLILNDDELAQQLQRRLGQPVGKAHLAGVYQNQLPEGVQAQVVYIGQESQLPDLLNQARKHNQLTITSNREHAALGVTLMIYEDRGLPSIAINMAPSRKLKLRWDSQVLDIAETIYD